MECDLNGSYIDTKQVQKIAPNSVPFLNLYESSLESVPTIVF